ncbi:hypothetical protein PBI_SCTP2_147 [Salicola phage SCTP-2]|nr:hypothetical protein PBI_SCTP2_147 [Salicola phage SCTP-2]
MGRKSEIKDMNESHDNKQKGLNKEYVYLEDTNKEITSYSNIVQKPVNNNENNKRTFRKLKKSSKKKNDYQCELCKKTYKTERGLLFHMCESKKRMNEKEHLYARIAFMAYIRFHQFIQPEGFKKRPKKYSDFVNSPYYKGFIDFGHYVADMNMNEPEKYIDFLIKNSVPLKDWSNDRIYELFITDILKKEKPDRAIERSIKTMKKWASENETTWIKYFDEASNFRILSNVKTGKISPWIIFNTKTGKQFLKSLRDNEIDYVYNIINPDYWNKKFEKNETDAKAVSNVLKNAGL